MEAFLNNSRLFKIHLVQSERDLFGNPISSDEWDKIAELLYEDTKHKVFQFVHPKKKGIVYERRYKICPVNGLTMLEVGKQGDFVNRATADGSNKACVVMIVQKAMNDAKVISRPSYRAFVEEFGSGEGRSAASYSELNNDHCHKYDRDPLYMKLLRIFSEFK